ncbi:MAG: undecaprenyl-diphosphatase UppP [Ignavibacteriales bacterium]|nr:MAG: undecaprenyl-diphosphatase UppP [Ignavibacteriaceae bacterium]MBW7873113.1 undecaprenyl-diphosphatase UppP [Ignavibacteria bacterium]MCZ2142756.1 undecaprenyl-diphosphatase UppP [Ignavibacteriales bacterium]MBV6443850.1 Undecaprenyl-diphosphatase [Ignavibacteriaceae bacterium]MBZ0196307.1 undecaprenyl-diphosphatase UppP [Ignavibacteriaceae bacterium]
MTILDAIILGIIQGITEFLPISSTGHLTIAGKFMGLIKTDNPEEWTAIIAIIQLGTLCSILIYFAKDIYHIVVDFFRDNLLARKGFKEQSLNSRLGWLIIIGTIPVVIIGLGFKDVIEGALTKNLWVIASSLIVLAIILFVAEKTAKFNKKLEDVGVWDAIVVGISQAFALIPGSSRSGTTITGGLFMGLEREAAARFSFLLSIPAILGSGLLELKKGFSIFTGDHFTTVAIATVVSGISGYMAIDFLLKYLRKNTTNLFIVYRIAAGLFILALLFGKVITP